MATVGNLAPRNMKCCAAIPGNVNNIRRANAAGKTQLGILVLTELRGHMPHSSTTISGGRAGRQAGWQPGIQTSSTGYLSANEDEAKCGCAEIAYLPISIIHDGLTLEKHLDILGL
jgi:hypothetical protein